MASALSIIRDEHRSLAAIFQGLLYLVEEIRGGRLQPDFRLFHGMIRYIEEFPEQVHHPKEDSTLFTLLRLRSPEATQVIEELEGEHVRGRELIARLHAAVDRYEREGDPAFADFAAETEAYVRFNWSHMKKEEEIILPAARRALSPDDWRAVDEAFGRNADPIAGVETRHEFRELFRRIAALAPAPIGFGRP